MVSSQDILKRLKQERKDVEALPPPGTSVDVVDGDPRVLFVTLDGPHGSPYEGGQFELSFTFGNNYPNDPPTVRFVTRIYHPNIFPKTGTICLPVLGGDWKSDCTLRSVLSSIVTLLSVPRYDTLIAIATVRFKDDAHAQAQYLQNKKKHFDKIGKEWTDKFGYI